VELIVSIIMNGVNSKLDISQNLEKLKKGNVLKLK